jgi:hypothetical protein
MRDKTASLVVKSRPLALQAHGACSSMAERHTVDVDVVGSKPIRHPKQTLRVSETLRVFLIDYLPFTYQIEPGPL